jgi:hypothetical protein
MPAALSVATIRSALFMDTVDSHLRETGNARHPSVITGPAP